MEHRYRYIILSLAMAAAVILYFIGLRRMKGFPVKKRNFFLTSFLISMALLGCSFDNSDAKGHKEGFGCSRNASGKDDPVRIKELNKTNEWKEFKALWKSLDIIEPGQVTDTESYFFGPYFKMKEGEYDKRNNLVDQLDKRIDSLGIRFQPLVEKKLLDTLEVRLLKEICLSRVEYIYYGNRSMMMRMAPPPGQVEKERSIAVLEFRIDLLLNLKKKNKIDSSELKHALANIENEIEKYSVLDIIGKRGFDYYSYDYGYDDPKKIKTDTINAIDRNVLEFEKAYEKFMKTYSANKADQQTKKLYNTYIRSKKELDEFTLIYPQFCDLIKDLILND